MLTLGRKIMQGKDIDENELTEKARRQLEYDAWQVELGGETCSGHLSCNGFIIVTVVLIVTVSICSLAPPNMWASLRPDLNLRRLRQDNGSESTVREILRGVFGYSTRPTLAGPSLSFEEKGLY